MGRVSGIIKVNEVKCLAQGLKVTEYQKLGLDPKSANLSKLKRHLRMCKTQTQPG